MNDTIIERSNWARFLKTYSSENESRPTRLGVFELSDGTTDDIWIEDGLRLIALDAYPNDGNMRIDIFLEDYVHPIDDVVNVTCRADGDDVGLDIVDGKGSTTVLRFENWK